ncbi:hypothetical protein ACWGDX_29745 [Streptomyces sp. NPDC055025]
MADNLSHRARGRDARRRLRTAARGTQDGDALLTLLDAEVLARAAGIARHAGRLPGGIHGQAVAGWQAAVTAIVTALDLAADHQAGRVPPPAPPLPRGHARAQLSIDWSQDPRLDSP